MSSSIIPKPVSYEINLLDRYRRTETRSKKCQAISNAGQASAGAGRATKYLAILSVLNHVEAGPMALVPSALLALAFVLVAYLLGFLTIASCIWFLIGSWSAHMVGTMHLWAHRTVGHSQ